MIKLTKKQREDIEKDVCPVAISQREELIGYYPIDSSIDLLEKLGYIIVKFPSKDNNLSGFCIIKSSFKCIYINTNTTLGRQHFSLWHEYYHLLTGEGIGVSFEDKKCYDVNECKAHEFASNFLMPEKMIKDYIKGKRINLQYIKNAQLAEMASYFKVSYLAMLYRLIKLYPIEGRDLGKRFNSARDRNKVDKFYKDANLENIYDNITNDIYVSESFFELISENYSKGRLPEERLEHIQNLLSNIEDLKNE